MDKPKFSEVFDFENLYRAAYETIRDKKFYPDELRFTGRLEENLIELQNQLIWHTYTPGSYYEFWVYDPKKRLICAPELKDRVIHTAVCRVVEKYIDPRLDYDSYACRKGKGTLDAANRAAFYANKYSHFAYFDIKGFFDSIPILQLEEVYLKRFIDDSEIMWLLHIIFMKDCNGVGIKKGCRTSQLSANVYLNELDHFIRHTLKAKAYVRYMDDFIIFSNDVEYLKFCWAEIARFLEEKLFLKLNDKTYIGVTSQGFEFVGYRIFKDYKIIRKTALDRSSETIKLWKDGKVDDLSLNEVTNDVHRRFIKAGINTVNIVAANARKNAIQNVQQNFTLRNNFTTKQIQFTQCGQNVQTLNQIKSEVGATEKAGYMARQEQGGVKRNKNGGNLIIPNTITRGGSNSKPVRRAYYYNNIKPRIVRGSTKFSSHKAALVARAFVAAKTQGFIRMNNSIFKVSNFRKAKSGNVKFRSAEILNLRYTQTITPKKEWLEPASEVAARDMQAIFNQQMDSTN